MDIYYKYGRMKIYENKQHQRSHTANNNTVLISTLRHTHVLLLGVLPKEIQ